VQNAGAAAAGTGLNKSAIIEKISLADAELIASSGNSSARINVTTVNATPAVINPNGESCLCSGVEVLLTGQTGATNYQGQLVFTGEGMGDDIGPSLYLVNPRPPYNSTGKSPLLIPSTLHAPQDAIY